MKQSEHPGLVDPVGNWLSRPTSLIALALVLFLAHLLLIGASLDLFSPYNFRGMWITIPDYDIGINDPDSALTRIYYRLNGWDGQWYYHIAAWGYHCDSIPESNNPSVCNVAFFPLVPMLGKALSLIGIDLVYALPLGIPTVLFFEHPATTVLDQEYRGHATDPYCSGTAVYGLPGIPVSIHTLFRSVTYLPGDCPV